MVIVMLEAICVFKKYLSIDIDFNQSKEMLFVFIIFQIQKTK